MKIETTNNLSPRYSVSQFRRPIEPSNLLVSSKFHRAAIDGYVDMLCKASKRDANLPDELNEGLTPTLLAAAHGQLEALRILVGRGGDPERTSESGRSALHLAAGRNHLNCASFLVNFGVNMWALDNELHTAKDIAAIEQCKEVLDYLDQVMAKQSALNTKSVQKFKEKAKLALEKRLKQMRKAQLKAIKQVERDERHLVKLSANRRLLKAAHSISDIKLVGRTPQPLDHHLATRNCSRESLTSSSLYSINNNTSNNLKQPSTSTSSTSSSSTKNSGHCHILAAKRPLHERLMVCGGGAGQKNNSAALLAKRQLNLCPSGGIIGHLLADESSAFSFSSSLSTSSSYLSSLATGDGSSCSNSGASSSGGGGGTDHRRPKYSDLVAVQRHELASSSAKAKRQEQQSLKSNSTLGTRLRDIGGVSRKVQLKRLLLVGGGSNGSRGSDIPNSSSSGSSSNSGEQAAITQVSKSVANNTSSSSRVGNPELGQSTGSTRLCTVQPAIKLKFNASATTATNTDGPAGNANDAIMTSSSSGRISGQHQHQVPPLPPPAPPEKSGTIKWPPAPAMTRAYSEPDFAVALRVNQTLSPSLNSVNDDDDDDDDEANIQLNVEQTGGFEHNGEEAVVRDNNNIHDSSRTDSLLIDHQTSTKSANRDENHRSVSDTCRGTSETIKLLSDTKRDESQHNLLTQCLSQIKMRHQEIGVARQQQQQQQAKIGANVELNKASPNCDIPQSGVHRPAAVSPRSGAAGVGGALMNGNSNELLQHQLRAGQFPLRPSTIKQQQQHHKLLAQVVEKHHHHLNPSSTRIGGFQFSGGGGDGGGGGTKSTTTTISIDSIGSAGSLAQRNGCSPSKSSQCSSVSSSIQSYSSSYSSSIEVSTANNNNNKQPTITSNANGKPPPFVEDFVENSEIRPLQQQEQDIGLAHHQINPKEETIAMFLMSNGLIDLNRVFAEERIDLEALMLLSEEDFKSLGILLGPRRKLLKAIQERRFKDTTHNQRSLTNNECCDPAKLAPMYVMVDTAL